MKDILRESKAHVIMGMVVIPIVALCVVALLYMLLPVTSTVSNILGLGGQQVGLLTTFFGLFYAFGFMVWGPLSDKYGRNKIILCGLLLLTLSTLAIPISVNYNYVLTMRCLQGFFASSFPPVILAWITENLSERTRRRSISLISCAFLLAGTIGQWYGVLTIQTSLTNALIPLGIIYLLGGVGFYFVTYKDKVSHLRGNNNPPTISAILSKIPSVLLDKNLIKIYFCALFVLMSFVSLYVLLNASKGNIMVNIGLLREVGTVGMLSCLFSGIIFKKSQPSKVLCLSLTIMTCALFVQYLMIFNNAGSVYIFTAVHFFFVVGVALAIPSMITCVTLLSVKENRGIAVSLYTCILFIGASLGSLVPVYLKESIFIFILVMALSICGGIMFFYKTKHKQ
ncbi:MFS transporter [Lonsdalea quercina]|uniref:MFS transporter n=1 Tax=Lonsdalea quercina TaxID=71657 RepID=UPI0039757118